MARNKRNEVAVGLFTVCGLGLLLLLIFLMGGLDAYLERSVAVRVRFRDVHGLQPGDPVYVFGQKLGSVRAISIMPRDRVESDASFATLEVLLSVQGDAADFLRETSQVRIGKSITGSLSVLMGESADGQGKSLGEGDFIVGLESRELSDIADELSGLLAEAKVVLGGVRRVVDGVEKLGSIEKTLARVESLATTLDDRTPALLERGEALLASAKDAIAVVDRMFTDNDEELRAAIGSLAETAKHAESFAAKLEDAPESVQESLTALRDAGRSVEIAVADNRPRIDLLIEDLGQTMANASVFSAEIKRRPWRLLY
jgi:ABC-type transporter Mla subunit MlaD